jgi:hypothetical protein
VNVTEVKTLQVRRDLDRRSNVRCSKRVDAQPVNDIGTEERRNEVAAISSQDASTLGADWPLMQTSSVGSVPGWNREGRLHKSEKMRTEIARHGR